MLVRGCMCEICLVIKVWYFPMSIQDAWMDHRAFIGECKCGA